ncbi:hypothetical protein BDZ97DRAFT_585476 [Flammula alnicola]|nr:hypothetical protein BDZ97DRAFT_585476 [Flammula alnicola]
MSNDSPRYLPSNTLNRLVESNVGSSRVAIKADLVGKIIYDDPAVFMRLRLDEVNNNCVAMCAASLKAENREDINLLKEFAEKASKKLPDAEEVEEANDKANDPNKERRSGNHGCAEEKRVYEPLVRDILSEFLFLPSESSLLQVRLFTHIINFDQATGPHRFQRTNGTLKADEPHTFGFPSVSPDIIISPHGVGASHSKKWRDRDAFCEVKPSKKQGPKPAIAGTIPAIVTQSADYERLFMSARPFMLFCVGIFGTEFSIRICDRDGVTFSPIYDMFQDTETLVRVVRSLTCNLSIDELGLDPIVRVLTDQETEELPGKSKYPSAPRQWCTIGSATWTSLSFLGHGTNVWRVREYGVGVTQQPFLHGTEMIMKTARRSSARTPESNVYLSIEQPSPEGLAKFECGGDLRFPECAGFPVTAQNLRSHVHKFLPDGDNHPPTPVLCRLVLGTVGRPMWEYKSDRDLLTGFRDALQAHKDLCKQGILHGDISPGNILLTEDQTAPFRGFITDPDFARIERSTLSKRKLEVTSTVNPQNRHNDRWHMLSGTETATRTYTTFESTVSVKQGAGMTGTTQFMAWQILWGVINPGKRVVHEAKHDVESFIWVLSYCVMRNLYHRAAKGTAPKEVGDQCKAFRFLFRRAFSQTTVDHIANERHSWSRGLIFPQDQRINAIITNFMSNALATLFETLQILVHRAGDPGDRTPLTHDALLAAVNDAIASLS